MFWKYGHILKHFKTILLTIIVPQYDWVIIRIYFKSKNLISIVHDWFHIVSWEQTSHSIADSFIPAIVVFLYYIDDCTLHKRQLIILVFCIIVYCHNFLNIILGGPSRIPICVWVVILNYCGLLIFIIHWRRRWRRWRVIKHGDVVWRRWWWWSWTIGN